MGFSPQNFQDQVGPDVSAAFLNGLDLTCNQGLNGLTTQAAIAAWLGVPTGTTPLAITIGGTGANNAATALANLGGVSVTGIGAAVNPITPAETTMGFTTSTLNQIYPVGHSLRYGIVPNLLTAAASNTTILRQLTSYLLNNSGWTGQFILDPILGNDFYAFSDFVDFRPGISVNLNWCTWQFIKAATTGNENGSGALTIIRDNVIENGIINFNFPSSTGSGCAGIFLGARGTEGTFFNSPPFYDANYLAATGRTMGNITLRNLYITSNAPGQRCIEALGGLRNVLIENVWADGQGVADGFYAEYGFATDGGGVAAARQSSHGTNICFHNYVTTNLLSTGTAIGYNGAYNIEINGLRMIGAGAQAISIGYGEAFYYNPWSGQDGSGSTKRTATISNVVAKNITGSGITIQGANTSAVAAGYLGATINALSAPSLYMAQSDLVGATIDNVDLVGTSAGNGLQIVGANYLKVTNSRIVGFGNGVQLTNEVTRFSASGLEILNSTGVGFIVGANFPVWSPARLAVGSIEDCFIAGSGSNAINVAFTNSLRIANNRFGYLAAHDGIGETTQDAAVSAAATALGVICDGNYVAAVTSGVAYALAGTSSGGSTVVNASGVTTTSGLWESTLKGMSADRGDNSFTYVPHADFTTQLFATTLTANRTMPLSTTTAVAGDRVRTVRSGLGAFTLTVNASTVLPSATAAWCEHEYNGTTWIEIGSGTLL
jgi:hypothetical protein